MKTVKASTKTTKSNGKRVADLLMPVIDKIVQLVGVAFILATSYAFTHDWLQSHQSNHDYSVAGGIMAVSIALYLVVRKR